MRCLNTMDNATKGFLKKLCGITIVFLLFSLLVLLKKRKESKQHSHQQGRYEPENNNIEESQSEVLSAFSTDSTSALEEEGLVEACNDKKNEDNSIKQEKPAMTKSQIINMMALIAAPVATLVTAGVAFFALKESVLQRETMYRPELYVGETEFYADLTDTAEIKYYRVEQNSIIRTKSVREPWMKINNVGMGSALHVNGTTDFRLEVASKAMKAMMVKRENPYDIYDTFIHGDDSLRLGIGSGMRWHDDYVLPLYQTRNECVVWLGKHNIDNMVKAALWLNRILHSRFQGYIIPVKLKYKDINEKWYVKETWMQIQCYTDEDKMGMRLRICSGIAQKEFMDEYNMWMNGESEDGRLPGDM